VALSPPDRARLFAKWMWLGAAVGFVNGLLRASSPWVGGGVVANFGEALMGAVIVGFLTRGVCWVWLQRQGS
jgi:hypothetical protein